MFRQKFTWGPTLNVVTPLKLASRSSSIFSWTYHRRIFLSASLFADWVLKMIHQKGLLEQIKKKLNSCFCRRIPENYWQPLLRLSTAEGGFSIFKKNTVEVFSVNIILFSFPMVIFQYFLWLIFSFLLQKKHGGNCFFSAGYLRW